MSFSVVVWIPTYAIYRLCKESDGGILTVSSATNVKLLSKIDMAEFVSRGSRDVRIGHVFGLGLLFGWIPYDQT
jgi:hypothetical protein